MIKKHTLIVDGKERFMKITYDSKNDTCHITISDNVTDKDPIMRLPRIVSFTELDING